MKKRIVLSVCILIFMSAVLFLVIQFSECSSIPWIHDLQYEWSHRRSEKKKDKMFSLLPQNVIERINEDDEYVSFKKIMDAITTGIADEVQRAVITFRILGLDDLFLFGGSGWDWSFSEILDGISMPAKIKAVETVRDEPQAVKAASWWLFKHLSLVGYDDAYERIPEEQLKVALPIATSYAMANWSRFEAHLAIKAISKIEGDTAKNLLRQIVTGQLPAIDHPSHVISQKSERNCSARALAALMLAQSGDMEVLEQIRKLSEMSEGDDKVVVNKALAILTKNLENKSGE